MGAKGNAAGSLWGFKALFRLEPLATLFHQAEESDRNVEERGGHPGQCVELWFGKCVEQSSPPQRRKPLTFIWGISGSFIEDPKGQSPESGSRHPRATAPGGVP